MQGAQTQAQDFRFVYNRFSPRISELVNAPVDEGMDQSSLLRSRTCAFKSVRRDSKDEPVCIRISKYNISNMFFMWPTRRNIDIRGKSSSLDVTVMTLEMSGRRHSEIPNKNQRIMKRTNRSIIPWISMSFLRKTSLCPVP